MGSVVFTDAYVLVSTSTSLGSRDLSNRVMKVILSRDADEHDDTTMGLTDRSRVIGLGKWSFKMDMIQSYTTTDGGENTDSLLDTLFTLSRSTTKFLVNVRQNRTNGQGPSNPAYQGLCLLKNYNPLDGSVGDLLKTGLEFLGSGNLSRYATSS